MPRSGRECRTRHNISRQILARAPDPSLLASANGGSFKVFVGFVILFAPSIWQNGAGPPSVARGCDYGLAVRANSCHTVLGMICKRIVTR